jgi:hypothetical protein
VRPGLGAAVRSGVVTFLALVVAFAIPLTSPSRVAAADPGASPAPVAATHQPTCAERFPADGPGGVDLQLGCVVRELIGYFGGLGPSDEPQRLTGYLLPGSSRFSRVPGACTAEPAGGSPLPRRSRGGPARPADR